MTDERETREARRLMPALGMGAVLVAALALAWWATRDRPGAATPGSGGHDHGAAAATADTQRTVLLTDDQARRIGVTYATVESGPLAVAVSTAGQVVVDETRIQVIAPKVDGWVERLHVNYTGQPVEAGAPLFDLYAPMVVAAEEEYLLARRLRRELDADRTGANAEAADLMGSARRRLAWWDVPADEIARLERTDSAARTITLRVPVDGIVLEKAVVAGQRIMAGDALYRVADLTTVWVEGEVYERDLRGVRVGQDAVATFDAFPGERWRGRIVYVQPTLSPETRTARIRITLANPGLRLKPGMYASLELAGAARPSVLSVPRSAVLATGARTLVFVRRADGHLEPRAVVVGATTSDRAEILAGLAAGEVVVASATFLVDAESNLGTALGGMGDMPGMEITTPPTGAPSSRPPR